MNDSREEFNRSEVTSRGLDAIAVAGEALAPAPCRRYGLIAGWGHYPVLLAQAMRDAGHEVVCLGVLNHADPALEKICNEFRWMGLGRFARACRFFRRHGVTEATMAGKIHKRLLFAPGFIWRQVPDLYTIRLFLPHFISRQKDCRDDSLLLTVVDAFARKGITLLPGTDFAPELLVKRSQITQRGPTAAQWKDICFGWQLAREMGRLDVGQSVAVKNQATLAIEAIEGTDEAIRRAGKLCPQGGFTVVKVAKPHQDMRFDVPTVGLGTLQTMVEAGAKVLAIEAKKTILVDANAVIEYANKAKLIILALSEEDVQQLDLPFKEPMPGVAGVV
ncbi:MAG: UDP-2,3-diacylglucosamine diphosphatase LpxI [Planctomycetia bacterium]|nr:UDP-2,3-diacylglucosamine diphosphatase LpxI [Planctomycetia bacterium]